MHVLVWVEDAVGCEGEWETDEAVAAVRQLHTPHNIPVRHSWAQTAQPMSLLTQHSGPVALETQKLSHTYTALLFRFLKHAQTITRLQPHTSWDFTAHQRLLDKDENGFWHGILEKSLALSSDIMRKKWNTKTPSLGSAAIMEIWDTLVQMQIVGQTLWQFHFHSHMIFKKCTLSFRVSFIL